MQRWNITYSVLICSYLIGEEKIQDREEKLERSVVSSRSIQLFISTVTGCECETVGSQGISLCCHWLWRLLVVCPWWWPPPLAVFLAVIRTQWLLQARCDGGEFNRGGGTTTDKRQQDSPEEPFCRESGSEQWDLDIGAPHGIGCRQQKIRCVGTWVAEQWQLWIGEFWLELVMLSGTL